MINNSDCTKIIECSNDNYHFEEFGKIYVLRCKARPELFWVPLPRLAGETVLLTTPCSCLTFACAGLPLMHVRVTMDTETE